MARARGNLIIILVDFMHFITMNIRSGLAYLFAIDYKKQIEWKKTLMLTQGKGRRKRKRYTKKMSICIKQYYEFKVVIRRIGSWSVVEEKEICTAYGLYLCTV